MSEKKLPIITINREYGAGGRALAHILSEKLDIPYYDRDFVKKTMDESGFDKEDVEREGEEMSRSSRMIHDFLNSTVSYKSSHDAIFNAEKKVILQLAQSPCILVGRCADWILAQEGIDTVSIYLHADMDKKLKRITELAEFVDMDPRRYAQDHDIKRQTFYKEYTGSDIFDASNYTFCFDVGKVSIPFCADIVLKMLEEAK